MIARYEKVIDQIIEGCAGRPPHEVFRTVRQRTRIKCREIADLLELSLSDISDIEHGRVVVSEDTLIALVAICGMKMSVIEELEAHPIKRK